MIKFYGTTDTGKVRELNEDSFEILEYHKVVILCDGMGGHAAGDVASKDSVETMADVFLNDVKGNLVDNVISQSEVNIRLPIDARRLVLGVRVANRRIYDTVVKQAALRGMGTTIVAAYFDTDKIYICHVGDSRAYRIRNKKIQQLTNDHSWVNELLQDKEITEEEAEQFQDKNLITRALGIEPAVKIDFTYDSILARDLYIFCSDGLTDVVDDATIANIYLEKGTTIKESTEKLVKIANENGGPDNITIITAFCDDTYPKKVKRQLTSFTLQRESEEIRQAEDALVRQLFGSTQIIEIPNRYQSRKNKFGLIAFFVAIFILIGAAFIFKNPILEFFNLSSNDELRVNLPIITDPPNASIYLNNKIQGTTPDTIRNISRNKAYDLRIELKGYKTKEFKQIHVSDFATFQNDIKLESESKLEFSYSDPKYYDTHYLIINKASSDTLAHGKIKDIASISLPSGQHECRIISENDNLILSKSIDFKLNYELILNLEDGEITKK